MPIAFCQHRIFGNCAFKMPKGFFLPPHLAQNDTQPMTGLGLARSIWQGLFKPGRGVVQIAGLDIGKPHIDHQITALRVGFQTGFKTGDGVFNAISIHGDVVGETVYIGPGAGRHATSSAVISDIVDAVKLLIFGGPEGRFPFLDPAPKNGNGLEIARPEEVHSRYYVRMRVDDRPGVMAEIASILASREVSLASVTQKEVGEGSERVSLIITTHMTTEKAIKETVDDLGNLDSVQGSPMTMPIRDFGD